VADELHSYGQREVSVPRWERKLFVEGRVCSSAEMGEGRFSRELCFRHPKDEELARERTASPLIRKAQKAPAVRSEAESARTDQRPQFKRGPCFTIGRAR